MRFGADGVGWLENDGAFRPEVGLIAAGGAGTAGRCETATALWSTVSEPVRRPAAFCVPCFFSKHFALNASTASSRVSESSLSEVSSSTSSACVSPPAFDTRTVR
jgi:hypothetical protein